MSTPAPLSSLHIRPRFFHKVELGMDETRDRLLRALAEQSPGIEVKSFPGYICLHIVEKDTHFWSPRLALSLEAAGEHTTLIKGTYGPDANVWSFFLYAYLIVGMVGIFSGILGFAQKAIDASPWGLWVFGGALLAAAFLYLFAQFGQKLGAWQTFQLHQAYQNALGEPSEVY